MIHDTEYNIRLNDIPYTIPSNIYNIGMDSKSKMPNIVCTINKDSKELTKATNKCYSNVNMHNHHTGPHSHDFHDFYAPETLKLKPIMGSKTSQHSSRSIGNDDDIHDNTRRSIRTGDVGELIEDVGKADAGAGVRSNAEDGVASVDRTEVGMTGTEVAVTLGEVGMMENQCWSWSIGVFVLEL